MADFHSKMENSTYLHTKCIDLLKMFDSETKLETLLQKNWLKMILNDFLAAQIGRHLTHYILKGNRLGRCRPFLYVFTTSFGICYIILISPNLGS